MVVFLQHCACYTCGRLCIMFEFNKPPLVEGRRNKLGRSIGVDVAYFRAPFCRVSKHTNNCRKTANKKEMMTQ